jgi:pyruvate ferredoxin oxidoreductase gamma subunit
MYAVRFHGRGGQGAKTASRILGTAAFLEGYQAQDSPIYGAERRGAPVAAFTRISRDPIRERGIIARPTLVVVADDSLLADPAARVSDGVTKDTALFVNTVKSAEQLRMETSTPGRLAALDLTVLVLQQFGMLRALSAPLGAVAARLLGLKIEQVREAVARELADLGLDRPVIEQNQTLAEQCYERVPLVPVHEATGDAAESAAMWAPVYEPPIRGTARITAGANAPLRRTGTWRTFRPVLVPDKCNGCWLCFAHCPEGVIKIRGDGKPDIDYDYCKGCMDCVTVCPTHALIVEREAVEERES